MGRCKLGIIIVAWLQPRMFCEESLGLELFQIGTVHKINSISWKRWLVWNKWTLRWSKKEPPPHGRLFDLHPPTPRIFRSKGVFDDTPPSPQEFPGNDIISLELRPLNFHVFIHTYSPRPQTYFRSSLTQVLNQFRKKSKYPEVGNENPLESKSCFV